MNSERLSELHKLHNEKSLFGRYISPNNIQPILDDLNTDFTISVIGFSVENRPIHSIRIGSGQTKILMWSQMHGNESTTTKAVFDLLNVLKNDKTDFKTILEYCTVCIIPMLNPDGSHNYSRVNANHVDLNRDAQDLSQPESRVLREVFDKFQPNYCFNLHGQRTIFGAGNTGNSATLSFLSPSSDENQLVTDSRKIGMAIIADIYTKLQQDLPNAIGRYDDGFNKNCVGDTFQMLSVPTVLFEAGHYKDDYDREYARVFMFKSICLAIQSIVSGVDAHGYKNYFNIPENEKNFFDVIIRNVKIKSCDKNFVDVAIQFKEELKNESIVFTPFVKKIELLQNYFAHHEIEGLGREVKNEDNLPLEIENEIVFVMLNGEKYLIKP